jgi:hypothetical protein
VRRAIALVVVMGGLLAGCGTLVVKPSGAAQSIIDVVHRKTGLTPTNVSCPSGVKAKVGTTFDCHFLGPGGTKYVAHMRITGVHGHAVDFYITTVVA